MALSDLIAADASAVFLNTEDFAETVTHRPLGNDGDDVAVTAIVVWDKAGENGDGGKGTKLSGRLDVAGSLAVAETDQWVVGGVLYQTLSIGEPQGGLRMVMIQRTKIERRTKARNVL